MLAGMLGDLRHQHTSPANADKGRLYPHLSFHQLLWWRRDIVLDSDILFAVVTCGTHLDCTVESGEVWWIGM